MPSLFTPEDLIAYHYGECDEATKKAIEAALTADWTLREKYQVIKTATERLNGITESPRTEAVLAVLRYAREKSKQLSVER